MNQFSCTLYKCHEFLFALFISRVLFIIIIRQKTDSHFFLSLFLINFRWNGFYLQSVSVRNSFFSYFSRILHAKRVVIYLERSERGFCWNMRVLSGNVCTQARFWA